MLDGAVCASTVKDCYLTLTVKSYDVVTVTFELAEITYHTNYIDIDYIVTKRGEQTVSVTPIDGIYPIYEE
jgi:beta-galactosidase beta subunit